MFNLSGTEQDEDNLSFQERNTPLLLGQEELAYSVGIDMAQLAVEEGCRNLFILSSPKLRAVQTMQMMKSGILLSGLPLKIRTSQYYKLGEIDQGQMQLPENYTPGMYVNEIKSAWEIFWEETFSRFGSDRDNPLYQFGDPVEKSDGIYKYPELKQFFIKPGECYSELSLRLYEAAFELGNLFCNEKKRHTVIIIITHGSPAVIFQMLENIGRKINKENFTFEPNRLMRLTWDLHNMSNKSETELDYGGAKYCMLQDSISRKTLDILEREIQFLRQLLND